MTWGVTVVAVALGGKKAWMIKNRWKLLPLVVAAMLVSCSHRHAGSSVKGGSPMSLTYQARHISVSIDRTPGEVYAFASNPANLPQWATGLSGSIRNINGEWIADAPTGKVKIRFTEKNAFGILDHEVTLESGMKIYVPMRVIANHKGSEIIFTLLRQPGMSDEKFAEDAGWVEKDLGKLKALLEKGL